MRELDDIDLLVICAEAVTEPQGVNLVSWTTQCYLSAGLHNEIARLIRHPSFDWFAKRHAAFVSRITTNANWYKELR